jgi:hypothetical protein
MLKKTILIATLLIVFFSGLSIASGAGLIPDASGVPCAAGSATDCGNYTIDDFVLLAINISQWVLGIVGTLSLIMFIYGGFIFLISAGSSESISKAKKIIIAAVIGLIIVFSSYMAIKFVLKSIGIDWNGRKLILTQTGIK